MLLPIIHAKEGLFSTLVKTSRELTAGCSAVRRLPKSNGIEIDLGRIIGGGRCQEATTSIRGSGK